LNSREKYFLFIYFLFIMCIKNEGTKRLHRVSKNVPPMACYNFDTHEQILIFFFGRNVTDKVGNQKVL